MVREVDGLSQPEPGSDTSTAHWEEEDTAEAILIDSGPDGQVLGLDRDDEALAAASQRLEAVWRSA